MCSLVGRRQPRDIEKLFTPMSYVPEQARGTVATAYTMASKNAKRAPSALDKKDVSQTCKNYYNLNICTPYTP